MSMQDWVSLCTAVGINVRNMEPMDVYLVAGNIIRDQQLTDIERRFDFDLRGAIKTLTADERLALRERATGVVPFKISSSKSGA
jgi:hypothetical protein